LGKNTNLNTKEIYRIIIQTLKECFKYCQDTRRKQVSLQGKFPVPPPQRISWHKIRSSTGRIFSYISSVGYEILLWVVTSCSSEKYKQENSKKVLSASCCAHFRTLKKKAACTPKCRTLSELHSVITKKNA
jgi:hypothetical protein